MGQDNHQKKTNRLLVLLPSVETGGAEIATLNISRCLILHGWKVDVGFERTPELEDLVKDFSAINAAYYNCRIAEKPHWSRQLRACLSAYKIIKQVKPDVIEIGLSWPTFGFGLRLICALFNLPTLVVFHYVAFLPKLHPFKKKVYNWVLSRRQFLVTVSKSNKEQLCHFYSINPEKIRCIYNGTSIPAADDSQKKMDRLAVQEEFKIPEHYTIMLTVANFYPNKGYEDLLEIVPRILQEFPNVIFLWAGNLLSQKKYFEEKIGQNNLHNNLRLLGFRGDIPRLLNAANFLLHPSHSEGFSLTLIEAMARQLPVLASDIGSNLEVLRHKENAFCYPCGNRNELCSGYAGR